MSCKRFQFVLIIMGLPNPAFGHADSIDGSIKLYGFDSMFEPLVIAFGVVFASGSIIFGVAKN